MIHSDNSAHTLSRAEAERVLRAAAAIDSAAADAVPIAALREAAGEALISSAALEAALRAEVVDRDAAPWWVRLTMAGVPDRSAAAGYYRLFVAGMIASPLLLLILPHSLELPVTAGFASFFAFASYTTSSAIKWLDRHGWDRSS